jgi:mRNA-degrading endonuclease RelE of RelBE toxin-antitoxin system
MNKFRIELAPAASKDLDTLEIATTEKVLSDLRVLEDNPFPRGNLIKKIKGKKSAFYRLRTDKFRVFDEIQQMKVVIMRVLSKKEADRFIKKL